jgi:Arc/MetJ-type ribon-helix-helix transcriptional regulator
MTFPVNLGPPYESIIDTLIEKGYAGNKSEVIRQALSFYYHYLQEEENSLTVKAVEAAMKDVRKGKTRTYKLDDVLDIEDKRRGL